jgi:hypothetical protein
MHKQINELLQKPMDRKDFLKHVALGVAVMSGGAALVKTLVGHDSQKALADMPSGYGSAAYGGAASQKMSQPSSRLVQ